MEKHFIRKQNRLKEYDYASPGAYFITICTIGRRNEFWNMSACNALRNEICLSDNGQIAKSAIERISSVYPSVSIDKYVIMPNHIHMILQINYRATHDISIGRIISRMKYNVTLKIGRSIWQKSFHDHIIRNQEDYNKIAEYIEYNPIMWEKDCFYDCDI